MRVMGSLPAAALCALSFAAAADTPSKDSDAGGAKPDRPRHVHLTAEEAKSEGSVTAGGKHIDYQAIAGTLVVHPKDWDDAIPDDDQAGEPGEKKPDDEHGSSHNPTAEAAMSFVAYFRHDAKSEARTADLPVQRWSRLIDRLAAHGRFRTKARDHCRRYAFAGRAL